MITTWNLALWDVLIILQSFRYVEVLLIARHCSGGIILAFEQFRADSGVVKPGTSAEKRVTAPQPFPSPWNHLESGILFGLKAPDSRFSRS